MLFTSAPSKRRDQAHSQSKELSLAIGAHTSARLASSWEIYRHWVTASTGAFCFQHWLGPQPSLMPQATHFSQITSSFSSLFTADQKVVDVYICSLRHLACIKAKCIKLSEAVNLECVEKCLFHITWGWRWTWWTNLVEISAAAPLLPKIHCLEDSLPSLCVVHLQHANPSLELRVSNWSQRKTKNHFNVSIAHKREPPPPHTKNYLKQQI